MTNNLEGKIVGNNSSIEERSSDYSVQNSNKDYLGKLKQGFYGLGQKIKEKVLPIALGGPYYIVVLPLVVVI